MDELRNKVSEDKRHILDELLDFHNKLFTGQIEGTEDEGKLYIAGFQADTARYVRDEWSGIRKGDVFVATYPKTGTNWTVDTVERIYRLKDSNRFILPAECSKVGFFSLALEAAPVEKFEILDDLHPSKNRIMFSHLDGEAFPVKKATDAGAKIIYVLRNPKDQTVSWYHFSNNIPFFKDDPRFGKDWKHFTKQYFAGKQPTFVREGEWYPEHILSWYKYKDQENVKFIYYEDMKKDFKKEIRNIASFLNVELTDEEVATVAHDCSFDVVKKNLDEHRSKINMLRKGGVGGWKEYFTVAQSEAIDAEFGEKLSNTDIKFTYQL